MVRPESPDRKPREQAVSPCAAASFPGLAAAGQAGSGLGCRGVTDDELLAFLFVWTWALATGRALRSDVPPAQLSAEELIDFWADDLTAAPPAPLSLPGPAGTSRARLQPLPVPALRLPGLPVPDGQVCCLFAVDVSDSAGRDDEAQRHIRTALYAMLEEAFSASGIPWSRCWREDRGDGVLVIVPPDFPAAALIGLLPSRLAALLRRYNRLSAHAARIQLRAAAHLGPVSYDGHGYIGSDVTLTCRLLDAQRLKRRVRASGAELALITSDYMYQTVIRRHPSLADAGTFEPATIRVKETRTRGWLHLPGGHHW